MEITDIRTFPLWAGGRNFLIVQVQTDAGIYGLGEAGLTWQEAAVIACLEHMRDDLIGQDPFRTEHLWQLLYRGEFFPGGKIRAAAISAIDIALWDIKAKALGQPLYNLLGGLCREKVVCYPHNGGRTLAELVESCQRSVEAGWKFVRWGLPQGPGSVLEPSEAVRTAVEQFDAVRSALGESVEICFDVHTRLDPPDTIRLCREVEPYRPFFMEDPLRSESGELYRALVPHVHVPLAVGEQWSSKWEFRALIEENLAHYARIDLCNVGGLTEALKIAHWCETHWIPIAPHNPLGPVSTAAALHLCLAVSNVGVLELPRKPGATLSDALPTELVWEDGYLMAPSVPGLGVSLDEEAAEAYAYRPGHAPRLRRRDGAFTNW